MKFNLTINPKKENLINDYSDFKSPFNHFMLLKFQEKIVENYYSLIESEKDPEDKNIFLCGMVSLVTSLPYFEKLFAIIKSKKMKLYYETDDETCLFLLDKIPLEKISNRHLSRLQPRKIPKLNKLISIYRTLKYNPIRSYFRLLNCNKQSFTISSLILEYFKSNDLALKYVFPQTYVNKSTYSKKLKEDLKTNELAQKFYDVVFDVEGFENFRLKELIINDLKNYFSYTRYQFDLLKKKKPPAVIFTGTGGMFTNRVIGLWAINKKSTVIRFAHGSSSAFFYESDLPARIIEMEPSSVFIFPTKKFYDFVIKSRKWNQKNIKCDLDYSKGHSDFLIKGKNKRREKSKILYVGAHLRNTTQTLSPNVFDTIYFEWQIFLVETLKIIDKNIESIVHPQSFLPRHKNPINSFDSRINFEDIIDDFDILIFDHFKSTTFAKSLCTEKQIVFIDIGGNSMINAFKEKIEERCNFIIPFLDKNNRLRVETELLKESIYNSKKFDNFFFKELYCG